VRLLSVNVDREGVIHPGFQVLMAILIGVEGQVFVVIFFIVIVIAYIGVSISLDVFSLAFSLQILELFGLGFDSLLQ
jgi:hypothetical protein